ncbi:protein-histidine N-methyltransferase [Martiniozyma asiatica (nom. inval.)]|nr:protein-histidine N-methyltransferase [Martiniozyma asiatica]
MGFSFNLEEEQGEFVRASLNCNGADPCQIIPIDDFVSSLVDIRVTHESDSHLPLLHKRPLFDVQHQLMCEDDTEVPSELFSNSDLQKNVYEGGLKTWECCYDLIPQLDKIALPTNYIEIGCGTSIPTLYLLHRLFRSPHSMNIVLTDYNFHVLRLVTLPNIIINWALSLPQDELVKLQSRQGVNGAIRDGEIDFTRELLDAFISWMNVNSVSIKFISGGWSTEWFETLSNNITISDSLVISSETVYNPDTLPVICEILSLLVDTGAHCIIGAKSIYFGVGGTIRECFDYWDQRGIKYTSEEVGLGVKRCIVNL